MYSVPAEDGVRVALWTHMNRAKSEGSVDKVITGREFDSGMRRIARREWWLWSTAILITLLLTVGILSFAVPQVSFSAIKFDYSELNTATRALVGLVLLFDIYLVWQQIQIYRIRRRLADREELFRLISENAADMIALVDASGHRIYNSPSYGKILGYTVEELESTSSLERVHPQDRALIEEVGREAFCGHPGRRIEYRMRHKDGTWRILESTSSAVCNKTGKVEKLVIVNRDITDRKRLEEQFRQAQKMEAVGQLSGGVAHDLNNILGVIIGYGEILQEGLPLEHPLRASADEILRAGHRAAGLTRQLLAFSRQQVLEPKVLDLNAVVLDMESMLRRLIGEHIELTSTLDKTLGTVKADQGQLEQVIMNLAVNARDAMPDGGKLIIETINAEMDETFVRRYPYPVKPGNYALLTVSDTGSGMDAATRARIFEPFFTTKEKGQGTGLGLSMVYGVVKQSEGYIDVYSEPGIGTTFKIYLPRVDEAIAPAKPQTALASALRGHETVLLVEDEGTLRLLTKNLLEICGYTVLEAKNGSEALDISQQHPGVIDLLLTDVVMPGINGRVLADQLTQLRPQIKVVFTSGYTGQIVGAHRILDPGSLFLQKPFTRDALARKLREALDGEQKSAAATGSGG
jgi:two-component system, cell cycle sensor histidine kinase and response regulator CckA